MKNKLYLPNLVLVKRMKNNAGVRLLFVSTSSRTLNDKNMTGNYWFLWSRTATLANLALLLLQHTATGANPYNEPGDPAREAAHKS